MKRTAHTWRDVDGLLLLDKPIGLSSNAALQRVRRLFAARKAGHCGSLDPMATGMLPVCFGEATKFAAHWLSADKSYRFRAVLGQCSSTGDIEGELSASRPVPILTAALLDALLQQFTGAQQQVPPMYSALKYQGQPLYRLARQGIEVERKVRTVRIDQLQLLDFGPDWIDCHVRCSKGTYIRTLAADIGEALGCGAHLSQLRRSVVQPFEGVPMYDLDTLHQYSAEQLEAALLPVDGALGHHPHLALDTDLAIALMQGRAVPAPIYPLPEGPIRLYLDSGRFIGLGERHESGRLRPLRLLRLSSLPAFERQA